MKVIPKIDIPGAETLSPLDMNQIHFETGKHSEVQQPASDPVKPSSR